MSVELDVMICLEAGQPEHKVEGWTMVELAETTHHDPSAIVNAIEKMRKIGIKIITIGKPDNPEYILGDTYK